MYERETDLCLRLRGAGLTSRDAGNALGLKPARVRAKLGGFEMLTTAERLKLIDLCNKGAGRILSRVNELRDLVGAQ